MTKQNNSLLERVAAYRCLHDTRQLNTDWDLYAFLSLFHPEKTHAQKIEFIRATHVEVK